METTIYEISEKILKDILLGISIEYDGIIEEDEVFDFLTMDKSMYETVIENYFENYDINFKFLDKKKIKIIMMLTLVSAAYKKGINDYYGDVNIQDDDPEVCIDDIEKLTSNKIIEMFYNQEEEIYDYIRNGIKFYLTGYISANKALELIAKNGKMQYLISMNPFECLNYSNYFDSKDILKTEENLHMFTNLHLVAEDLAAIVELSEANDEEMDEEMDDELFDDSEFYDDEMNSGLEIFEDEMRSMAANSQIPFTDYDVSVKNILHSLIKEKCNNDETEINNVYGSVFSNVYQNLKFIYIKDRKGFYEKEIYPRMFLYFENENVSIGDAVNRFVVDDEFGLDVIDCFIGFNEGIEREVFLSEYLLFQEIDARNVSKKFNSDNEIEKKMAQKIIKM